MLEVVAVEVVAEVEVAEVEVAAAVEEVAAVVASASASASFLLRLAQTRRQGLLEALRLCFLLLPLGYGELSLQRRARHDLRLTRRRTDDLSR